MTPNFLLLVLRAWLQVRAVLTGLGTAVPTSCVCTLQTPPPPTSCCSNEQHMRLLSTCINGFVKWDLILPNQGDYLGEAIKIVN